MTSGARGHNRRKFLGVAGGLAGAALTGWTPAFQLPAEAATLPTPPNFPGSIPLGQQAYQNWSEQIDFDAVWTATPATAADVVTLANWAHGNGYRLRAKGMQHNWSPILLPEGADASRVILVDTTAKLTGLSVTAGSPATATVQSGTSIDDLQAGLEQAGYGLLECTAPGDLTVGGVLAIGGHGSGVPATGETRPAGGAYGSLANLVHSLTAVVWNGSAYVLKTFSRTNSDIGAFLVHLGRAFVTEVTLQVIPNQRLRCQNWCDVSATDLFGPPGDTSTLDNYLTAAGRVEAIWFPFTGPPWLKVWSVSPAKPALSREIDAPYPYTFANFLTQQEADFLKEVEEGDTSGTPAFTNAEMALVGSGLITTGTWDVWGWSKNTLLYVQPTTLRIVEGGWAVLTRRADVQQVLHEFFHQYQSVLSTFQAAGEFPMNGPIEIRITGIDTTAEVAVTGAVEPLLSPVRPRPDHPEWDTCVWLDMGTLPGTPTALEFYTEMETWIWQHYSGDYAAVRPEWSKAWAHAAAGAWTDQSVITGTIPAAFRAGQPDSADWDTARTILNAYDPARVFSNPFLDVLLP
ncbi:MAG TPA: cholesterol oxidase substrate-binding domain-containing protein [Pseudonocardiaceae bacterium]|nr:cholesterol oxidase substrate-binding domain-containing protein [Pseudonocardiaceae bacterium]